MDQVDLQQEELRKHHHHHSKKSKGLDEEEKEIEQSQATQQSADIQATSSETMKLLNEANAALHNV